MSGPIAAWIGAAVLACWCVGAYNRLVRLRAAAAAAFAEAAAALAARHRRIDGRLAAAPPAAGDDDAAAREAVDAALRQSRAAADHALRRPSAGAVASLALAERVLDGALAQWPGAAAAPTATVTGIATDTGTGDTAPAADAPAAVVEGAWHAARERFGAAAAAYEAAAREFPTRIVARVFGFAPAGRL